jgi:hypothetical protein
MRTELRLIKCRCRSFYVFRHAAQHSADIARTIPAIHDDPQLLELGQRGCYRPQPIFSASGSPILQGLASGVRTDSTVCAEGSWQITFSFQNNALYVISITQFLIHNSPFAMSIQHMISCTVAILLLTRHSSSSSPTAHDKDSGLYNFVTVRTSGGERERTQN